MSRSLSFGCNSFLEFFCFCFWWPWQFWSILVWYFAKCLSTAICLVFFSCLDYLRGFERKIIEAKCRSHHITQNYNISPWLIIDDADLDHLAEVVFIELLHLNILFFCPLHTTFLKRSCHTEPTVRLHFLQGGIVLKILEILLYGRFICSPVSIFDFSKFPDLFFIVMIEKICFLLSEFSYLYLLFLFLSELFILYPFSSILFNFNCTHNDFSSACVFDLQRNIAYLFLEFM